MNSFIINLKTFIVLISAKNSRNRLLYEYVMNIFYIKKYSVFLEVSHF